ncbi:uncharacterized protein VICG_00361 [Vittaforma corneae ATCC 50505]|uniref:Cdc37 N-terminal domain-containing protein n=1 Tax=Vittaforma corneae (strain ATCC 50505) TaxID=993615 RepID=L2GPU6_VITCO|nr:uncharacterized protein VICG_00361 [Vittaforma corneae ATCC 50505]ELA42609.1 hypothetical protein VICG_00361 [Vittaforma corneae ATCC 50505]
MNLKYRDPETLSSEEEVHQNIDTRSYRKFIKETRLQRLNELKTKKHLSQEETKELQELEYKFLPVDREVSEESFRTSKDDTEADYTDDLIWILHNNTVRDFIDYMDKKIISLEAFEELVYLNISEMIKIGNDEMGFEFCKIGLMARWAREFGRCYLLKFEDDEERFNEIVEEHYKTSKSVILNMRNDDV